MGALLKKEEATWKWSPLFRAIRKFLNLPLRYRGWPFAFTVEELEDIIRWASEEVVPGFAELLVLGAFRALKHISRAAVGPSVALAWPKNYFLVDYLAELRFAAEDLITFGHLYFLGLPLLVQELEVPWDGIEPVGRQIFHAAQRLVNSGKGWV
jgi:hypothetical protein